MNDRRTNLLLVVLVVLPFVGCFASGLFDLDEGYYAAVTTEMIRRHEWVTPYYNGAPWFEKPILLYWCAKPCVMAFGPQIGMRVPSVLASLGTIALTFDFVRRRFDVATAWLAAMLLATSALFVGVGRMALTDPLLVFALCGGLYAFWDSVEGDAKRRPWAAFFLGLAVLAKGPVALLLFVPIATIAYLREPSKREGFRGGWLLGSGVFLAVVAAWYVPAYLAKGQVFVQKFLIEQNVGRFTGGDAAHTVGLASAPMYIVVLLIGVAPWSIAAFAEAARGWRERLGAESFLAIWATIVFAFFTVSSAKLPHYVAPCVPPLAILAAVRLRDRRWATNTAMALAPILALLLTIAQNGWYEKSGQAEAHAIARELAADGRTPELALFQLSRRESGRATGTTRLQETSLPSLLAILNDDILDAETVAEVANAHKRILFTRVGRVDATVQADFARRGLVARPFPTRAKQIDFAVYEIEPLAR